MKRVLLDHRVRPDCGHQLILADDLAFGSASMQRISTLTAACYRA
jgi:hypothetical protein